MGRNISKGGKPVNSHKCQPYSISTLILRSQIQNPVLANLQNKEPKEKASSEIKRFGRVPPHNTSRNRSPCFSRNHNIQSYMSNLFPFDYIQTSGCLTLESLCCRCVGDPRSTRGSENQKKVSCHFSRLTSQQLFLGSTVLRRNCKMSEFLKAEKLASKFAAPFGAIRVCKR